MGRQDHSRINRSRRTLLEARWCFGLLFLAGLGTLSSCAFKGEAAGTAASAGRQEQHRGAEDWYPQPTTLRIYPGTRFVLRQGQPQLEARVELLDAMGDPIKHPGSFQFELYAVAEEASSRLGPKLYQWNVAVRTQQEHRESYDGIIRGYAFRLRLDAGHAASSVVARPAVLRAVFQHPATGRLTTEAQVHRDW